MCSENQEIIAINEKALQKSDFIEIWKKVLYTGALRIPMILLIIISAYYLLMFIWGLFLGRLEFFMLILACVCWLFLIVLPYTKGKLSYKQHLTMTEGGSVPRKTVFYGDNFEILINNAVTSRFRYSQVKKTAVTKNCYLFYLPNRIFHFVRLDGFTQEEFDAVRKRIDRKKKTDTPLD